MGFFLMSFSIVSTDFFVALSLIYHLLFAVICVVCAQVTKLHCIIETEYYAFLVYKEYLNARSIGPKLLKSSVVVCTLLSVLTLKLPFHYGTFSPTFFQFYILFTFVIIHIWWHLIVFLNSTSVPASWCCSLILLSGPNKKTNSFTAL